MKYIKIRTKTTAGANIDPVLPIIEHELIMVVRTLVGHCSAVNTYNELNASVIEHFPSINKRRIIVEFSAGTNDVTIVANAVTLSAQNSNILRFIRFSNGNAINNPGISMATTKIKLIYLFSPGTCVAINDSP